ncbi:hypothetical protein N431DRAFT_436094 [Stipitochalara longipes BDJ]|nr:hypothetical protein N431DRAFT_436094 [Stipitochalara longipes BDJ]
MYLPVPNYRQSFRDISVGMAISGVSTTRSLDLVPLLGCGCNDISGLPSWTPSWFNFDQKSSERQLKYLAQGRPRIESSKHAIKGHKYAAAGSTMAKVHFINEVLHTHAFLIDEVDGLTYTLSEGGKPLSFRNMSRSVPEADLYHDNETLVVAAAGVLSRGMVEFLSPDPKISLALVCGCIKLPLAEKDPSSETSLPISQTLQTPPKLLSENNCLRERESRSSGLLKLLLRSIKCEPLQQDVIHRR